MEFQGALRSFKDLEVDAPSPELAILVNEQTSDDADATTVFSRIPRRSVQRTMEEPVDDERTVVEAPALLNETLKMVRAHAPQSPGRKR